MSLFLVYISIFLIGTLIIFSPVLFDFSFHFRQILYREGGVVEIASALLFLFVVIFSGFFWFRRHRFSKIFLLVFVFSLLCFLSEISFGRGLLWDFSCLRINEIRIDALHDFFELLLEFLRETHSLWKALIIIVFFGTLVIVFGFFLFRSLRLDISLLSKSSRTLFISTVCQIFIALLIDAKIILKHHFSNAPELIMVFEEYLEMMAAVALIFFCISLIRNAPMRAPLSV